MAHFAKIENILSIKAIVVDNVTTGYSEHPVELVTQVIVVNNETLGDLEYPASEKVGQDFIASLGLDGTWKQTSYNANFRDMYAGVGDTYDSELDIFIAPI